MNSRTMARGLGAAALMLGIGWAVPAVAAADSLSYVGEFYGSPGAYLLEPLPRGRARVVNRVGAGEGVATVLGAERTVNLDQPITSTTFASEPDVCDFYATQRQDVLTVLFRQLDGSTALGRTAVVEMGTLTNLDGCEIGKVTPFGAPTDAGNTMLHRAMSLRAPMTDLVPGAFLAGMKETQPDPAVSGFAPADVVKFLAGSRLRFLSSGSTVNASLNAAGWQVLGLAGFERGYTRLSVDPDSGAETWLEADFVGGQPVTVNSTLMVKPARGASFGSVAQASRMWESGLFVGSPNPFFIYLYRDGTGERVSQFPDTGEESRTPITWAFDGLNIVQQRSIGDGTIKLSRTWQPLATRGLNHFVMESELVDYGDGNGPQVFFPARVNFYVDRGRATPLPQASFHHNKPAITAGTAKMPRKIGNSSATE